MTTQYHEPAGIDALLTLYIDVVNRAISENYDTLYGKAAKLWARVLADVYIGVAIYKIEPDCPYRWYTIGFSGGRLALIQVGRHPDARAVVKAKDVHLVHVVQDPDAYVKQPLRGNLDWLLTRFGLR